MKSILVCTNHRINPNVPSCGARDAMALKHAIEACMVEQAIALGVKEIQCLGECDHGPNVRFVPSGPLLRGVNQHDLASLITTAKAFAKD